MRSSSASGWATWSLVCMLATSVQGQQAVGSPALALPKPNPGYEWVLITQEDGTKLPQQVRVVSAAAGSAASASSSNSSSPSASASASNTTRTAAVSPLQAELKKKASSINVDRPLGSAAAFVALDVSPQTVTHPSTPRELAAGLLNGVDHNGVLQTGLALEVAPVQMFHRGNYNIDDYNARDFAGTLGRILYNTSFSIATTKASSGDDKAQRLGLGIHFTFFDSSDPKASPEIQQIARDAWDSYRPPIPRRNASAAENAAADAVGDTARGKFIDERIAEWRKKNWAQTAWDAAWAPTWLSSSGNAGDLSYDGSTAYTTFAYALDDPLGGDSRLQLIAQARFREGEFTTDPADPTLKGRQNTLIFGGRVRYGSPDLNGSAELAYVKLWGGPLGDGDTFRYSVGLEKKIAENLWLTLNAGEELGEGKRDSNLFALGGIRFGSADKPQIASPGSN